ncbi:GNAT family N-acetyltransferase [Albimonas pacifica]|uniref:GNAT family N-acetyltransferase n=1 Tax=Albimonas pacifica TaxID=1114924 RepID=UPI0015A6FC21|nr:GNAT family N-acetyltransferase [Albimonas pacifica]
MAGLLVQQVPLCRRIFVLKSPRRLKSISAATRELLAHGENALVDYKRKPEGVSQEDFVSFANSADGGIILIGVNEVEGPMGEQVGEVVGCDVSDSTMLAVTNKALSCVPPVAIEIYVENLSATPFLKVAVPASASKPHCTTKGIYCQRDGSRNRPLQPGELLKLFLDSESAAFAARFAAAADSISSEVGALESSLAGHIERMSDTLGWSDQKLDDTESLLDDIKMEISEVIKLQRDSALRFKAIFNQDGRSDPLKERARRNLKASIVQQASEDERILEHISSGKNVELTLRGEAAEFLSRDDVREILQDSVDEAREAFEQKRYTTYVGVPEDFDEHSIASMAELIERGGEVAVGVKARLMGANWLGLITHDDVPVGVAAIKKPAKSYRERVFVSAGYLAKDACKSELGWIYLDEAHRRKGKMASLLAELWECVGDARVFATTRVSNEAMVAILKKLGFAKFGGDFPSRLNESEMLSLYVVGYPGSED